MFGEVTDGKEVLDEMEAVGSSPMGTTSKAVLIEDCGQIDE